MPKFIMTYQGGTPPATPEDGQAMMAKWQAWMKDNADVLVEPQNPLGKATAISSSGPVEATALAGMMGYSVVQADNMEAAVKIAKSCPFLDMANAVMELAEVKSM
jgi:hypothetical protein